MTYEELTEQTRQHIQQHMDAARKSADPAVQESLYHTVSGIINLWYRLSEVMAESELPGKRDDMMQAIFTQHLTFNEMNDCC